MSQEVDHNTAEYLNELDCLRPVDYTIAAKALQKWRQYQLRHERTKDGAWHFTFCFLGSTCSNGGIAIESMLHAIIRRHDAGMVFERGWIEFDPADRGLVHMCEYNQAGETFKEELGRTPPFGGRVLEDILQEDLPLNPGGCFCKQPHRNHKWRIMLATVHFALTRMAPAKDV